MHKHNNLSPGLFAKHGILREHTTAISFIQQALDIFTALGCLYCLTVLKAGNFEQPYQYLALTTALLMALVYQWADTYRNLRTGGLLLEAQSLFKAWGATLVTLGLIGFATKTGDIYSREILFKWALAGYVAQVTLHGMLRLILQNLRAKGLNTRTALLVGNDAPISSFHDRIASNPWLGIKVIGYLACGRTAECSEEAQDRAGFPRKLGELADAERIIREHGVDLAYIALPITETAQVEEITRTLVALNIDVHWVPDLSALQLLNHGVREIDGQPIICLSDSPLDGIHRISKRLEDIILASAILILVSPLLLLIAAGVKLSSSGPVLFRQRRGGLDGQEIIVWKFRTMHTHPGNGVVSQATKDDPRVTPLGAILRRTSLDEFPQFINVLQGRMSIVGPRPHAIEHDEFYMKKISSYMLRHRIKPGITGWAQVNGWRGETNKLEEMEMRVKYDLYYINNWSVWFDLKIIALTLFRGFVHEKAY